MEKEYRTCGNCANFNGEHAVCKKGYFRNYGSTESVANCDYFTIYSRAQNIAKIIEESTNCKVKARNGEPPVYEFEHGRMVSTIKVAVDMGVYEIAPDEIIAKQVIAEAKSFLISLVF